MLLRIFALCFVFCSGAMGGNTSIKSRTEPDLIRLVHQGDLQKVQTYLSAHSNDVDQRDALGFTPLMIAAKKGKPKIVKALLDAGANTKLRSRLNRTAFKLAEGNLKTSVVFLKHFKVETFADSVPIAIENGRVDLLEEFWHGWAKTFKNDMGNVVYEDSVYKADPLRIAIVHREEGSLEFLLKNRIDPDLSFEDPLFLVMDQYRWAVFSKDSWAQRTDLSMLQILLKNGADPHRRMRKQRTPFELAKELNLPDLFEKFLIDKVPAMERVLKIREMKGKGHARNLPRVRARPPITTEVNGSDVWKTIEED